MAAPLPVDETFRLAALGQYDVLDSDPEANFNDIARIASFICRSPIAAISLIDRDRQWFKAAIGLAALETPRDQAFCAHTILSKEVMVVEDATLDERFRDNPYVKGEPRVRFYAGAPLITPDNFVLGALCVIDHNPRKLSLEEKDVLECLARLVMTQLQLRRATRELASAEKKVKNLSVLVPICSYCKDVRDDKGYWNNVEEFVTQTTGADFSHGLCPKCAKIHFPETDPK